MAAARWCPWGSTRTRQERHEQPEPADAATAARRVFFYEHEARISSGMGNNTRTVMSQRIDVGVLGATGMVGQQFIAQLAAHPWFNWPGSAPASDRRGRRIATQRPGGCPCRRRPISRSWSCRRPAGQWRTGARVLCHGRLGGRRDRGGVCEGRARRREQLAQPPDGAGRAAAGARDEQRPHRPHRGAACGPRLGGRAGHEPELLDGVPLDGAGATAPVRPEVGRW